MSGFITQKQKLIDAVTERGWVSTADLTDLLYSHRWCGGPDGPWVVIKTSSRPREMRVIRSGARGGSIFSTAWIRPVSIATPFSASTKPS